MRLSFTNIYLTCYSIKWTVHDVIQKSWNKFSSCLLSLHFITIEPFNIYILKALGEEKKNPNSTFAPPLLHFWTWTDIIYINGSTWASEAGFSYLRTTLLLLASLCNPSTLYDCTFWCGERLTVSHQVLSYMWEAMLILIPQLSLECSQPFVLAVRH